MMPKLLLVLVFLVFYKLISNYQKLKTLEKHKMKFLEWLHNHESHEDLIQDRTIVKELIESAGIKNTYTPVTKPSGFGMVTTAKVNIFDNYPSDIMQYAYTIMDSMESATGVFKKRIKDATNPLYWVEFIIFLPKHAITYVGLDADSTSAKVVQLFWWFLFPLTLMFRENIYSFIAQCTGFF